MGREGEDTRASGHFYITFFLSNLLFGSEMWVVIPRMVRTLEGTHHQVARQLTGKLPKCQPYRVWDYPQ